MSKLKEKIGGILKGLSPEEDKTDITQAIADIIEEYVTEQTKVIYPNMVESWAAAKAKGESFEEFSLRISANLLATISVQGELDSLLAENKV